MNMRACDVLSNIKHWPAWDYKTYRLTESESKPVLRSLENYIWHSVDKEGLPEKEGCYLIKLLVDDNIIFDTMSVYEEGNVAYSYGRNLINCLLPEGDVIAWRYIVDEE